MALLRPTGALPSPPHRVGDHSPITEPRTVGRTPFQRLRPALPRLPISPCCSFPTTPTVARQFQESYESAWIEDEQVHLPSEPNT